MKLVLIIAAGVVVGILIGTGLAYLRDWFSSRRSLTAHPPEVHLRLGGTGTLLLFASRKRARSATFYPVQGTRTCTVRNRGNVVTAPTTVAFHDGLATVPLTGVVVGTGTLVFEIAGSTGSNYGPTSVPVQVYALDAVPNAPLLPNITVDDAVASDGSPGY